RLREINLARYHRRFGETGQRPGHGRQPAGAQSRAASFGDVSGIGAVSLAEYFRERDVRLETKAGPAQFRAAGGRKVFSSSGRSGKINRSKRARAFLRDETARGISSSARAESARVID